MSIAAITPPTDNLYKFAAVGGLAAAVALFVVMSLRVDKLEEGSARLTTDVALSQVQMENLEVEVAEAKQDADELKKAADSATARVQQLKKMSLARKRQNLEEAEKENRGLDVKLSSLGVRGRDLENKLRELHEKSALNRAQKDNLHDAINRTKRDIGMMTWQGGFALMFSLWGFWQW